MDGGGDVSTIQTIHQSFRPYDLGWNINIARWATLVSGRTFGAKKDKA
jgi:hypothetical protein